MQCKKLNQGQLSVPVPFINVITLTFYCAITVCTLLPMCSFNINGIKKKKRLSRLLLLQLQLLISNNSVLSSI